jgi:hypothetical protein
VILPPLPPEAVKKFGEEGDKDAGKVLQRYLFISTTGGEKL